MREYLVVLSGLVAGFVQWFPCGIGIAAHRYKLGGFIVSSNNKWVQLSAQFPEGFSPIGKLIFLIVMLLWIAIFFGALAIPILVAKFLNVPEDSPFVNYAIYSNFLMAVIAFAAGPAIWRRLAR